MEEKSKEEKGVMDEREKKGKKERDFFSCLVNCLVFCPVYFFIIYGRVVYWRCGVDVYGCWDRELFLYLILFFHFFSLVCSQEKKD